MIQENIDFWREPAPGQAADLMVAKHQVSDYHMIWLKIVFKMKVHDMDINVCQFLQVKF